MDNSSSPLETLRQLKEMLDAGALTPTEFEALKQRLVFSPAGTTPPPPASQPPPAAQPPAAPPASTPTPLVTVLPSPGLPVWPPVSGPPNPTPPPPAEPGPRTPTSEGAAGPALGSNLNRVETPATPAAPGRSAMEATPPPVAPIVPPAVAAPPLPAAAAPLPRPAPVPRQVVEPLPRPAAVPQAEGQRNRVPDEYPQAEARTGRSPLALILSIGGLLALLGLVLYLSWNRHPSEHISSLSQTAADSVSTTIETGPQAAQVARTESVPETIRVVPAHPAPPVSARPAPAVRDSVRALVPAAPTADSTAATP